MDDQISGDYQLWRDFDWDVFLEGRLETCKNEKQRAETRAQVELARRLAKAFSTGTPTKEELAEMKQIYDEADKGSVTDATVLLAQIANVFYTNCRKANYQLTFAATALAKSATACREENFRKILPIITRFAKESAL